jgi:ubiquinone/menaquinone biosynthesis C-methylase UbiE
MNYPNDFIAQASQVLLHHGIRVLQGNRFAKSEGEHIAKLIEHMKLDSIKAAADMGCGFGEISLALSRLYPEAHFYLVNCNEFQLGKCPTGPQFSRMLSDMCKTTIPRESVDLVMFNYSLCHVDPTQALWEAARIAQPGARLFVYDYLRIRGDDTLTQKHLSANFMSDLVFRTQALLTGWSDIETVPVAGDDTLFRVAMGDDTLYDSMFDSLSPVIWRAKR